MRKFKPGQTSKDTQKSKVASDAVKRPVRGFSQESLKIAYAFHNLEKAHKEAVKVIIMGMVTGNELRELRRGKAIVESRP